MTALADYAYNHDDLPDTVEAAVGVNKTSQLMPKIKNAINYAYARAMSPIVSQAWPDGDLFLNHGSANSATTVLQWRVPCFGEDFDQYTIVIKAKTDQAFGGTVRVQNSQQQFVTWQLQTGGANPAAGAVQTNTLTLQVAGGGTDEYDLITLGAICDTVQNFTLLSVDIYCAALASPLTPGMREPGGGFVRHLSRESRGALHPLGGPDFAPIGGNRVATNEAMSAALGRYVLDGLTHVDSRQKVIQCFSSFYSSTIYAQALITVDNRAQIANNSTITLVDAAGVNHVFTFKLGTANVQNNTIGLLGTASNTDVADRIEASINASNAPINVTGRSGTKVLIGQTTAGTDGNRVNTETQGVEVSDFAGGKPNMSGEHDRMLLPAVTLNRQPGTFPSGTKVRVHVRALNPSGSNAFVIVDCFDVAGSPPIARNFGSFNGGFCRITVPPSGSPQWFTETLTVVDHGGGSIGASTQPSLEVGVLNAQAAGVDDDVPLATVVAWSVWGDV